MQFFWPTKIYLHRWEPSTTHCKYLSIALVQPNNFTVNTTTFSSCGSALKFDPSKMARAFSRSVSNSWPEEYRAEPGSVRNAGSQTNIFPVDGGRRSKLNWRRVHVEDRLQVSICEPVEVDDDGDIFGRQRINGTDRIFVRWTLLATRSNHRPHALHDSSLA